MTRMSEQRLERKITVILATDVVAYSKHVEADETGTINTYRDREAILLTLIEDFRGRVFNTAGDSVLAEFASAVDAVECAAAFQTRIVEINDRPDAGRKLAFRIGINMGDVVLQDGNLLGDGVNIAARLEALAQPNGVLVSKSVHDLVAPKTTLSFTDLGLQKVKDNEFHAFDLMLDHTEKRRLKRAGGRGLTAIAAALVVAVLAGAAFLMTAGDKLDEKPGGKPDDRSDNRGQAVLATSIPVILVEPIDVSEDDRELQKPFTESVISGLSGFRGINVLSSNNSFFIANAGLSDPQIAAQFNVDFIVRGTIQTYGNRSRMNVSLADLAQNKVMWSDQIDFTIDEIFDLQDRVNDAILSQLQIDAVAGDIVNDLRDYAGSFEFLTLYLNWSTEIQKWDPESHKRAATFLDSMRALDADNLLLHNATGWQTFQKIAFGLSTDFAGDVDIMKQRNQLAIDTMGRGEDYAQRAMFEYFFFSKTCEAALADIETALGRGQNVRVHQITGAIYAACERVEEAVIYNRKALAATPNDTGWFLTVDLVSNLWKLDRYDDIREVIEDKIDAADMDQRVLAIFAVVEHAAGNTDRAEALLARATTSGLVPDRIKTWLRGQPAALKLIEQINEIAPF